MRRVSAAFKAVESLVVTARDPTVVLNRQNAGAKRTTLSAEPEVLRQLDFLAVEHGCTRNHLILQAIGLLLDLAGRQGLIEPDTRLRTAISKAQKPIEGLTSEG